MMNAKSTLPTALNRRRFLSSSAAALCSSVAAPWIQAQSTKRPASGSHEVMSELYHSLSAEQ